MGIAYNTSIVRDGLVLHLDAANVKSYPGSGTTWKDLSGNGNDGTLTNGPTYSSDNKGNFSFDGVDEYVDLGNKSIWNSFGNSITVECVFLYNSVTNDAYGRLVSKFHTNNATAFSCFQITADQNSNAIRWSVNGVESRVSTIKNQIYHVIGYYDGSNSKMYLNGELQFTLNVTGDVRTSSFPLSIGGGLNSSGGSSSEYHTGKIYNAKIYNRALTESEIKQNFEATRGRYGI